MKNKTNSKSGLSFGSVLTLVFIALKLMGFINWKWVWVLCPLWIGALISIIIFIGTLIYMFVTKE